MAKNYDALIDTAGKKYNVDPALIRAVIGVETGGQQNPESAVSSTGAVGLGQLMPSTARALGVTDRTDPAQNINGAAKLLDQLLTQTKGNVQLALTMYHGGQHPENWGPKTQAYPGKVLSNIKTLPGVPDAPAAPADNRSDDDIFAAFGAAAPAQPAQSAQPAQGASDDDIFSAFTQQAPEQKTENPVAPQAKTAQPADYGFGEGAGSNFIDALGHNAGNVLLGAAQTGLHGLSAIENGIQNIVGGSKVFDTPTAALDQFIQQREQNYQQNVPTNVASVAGAGVGQVAPFLVGGGGAQIITKGGQTAARLADLLGAGDKVRAAATLGGQTAGSSLLGLLASGAQPVTQGDFASEKAAQAAAGAGIGAVIPGATKALGTAAEGAGNFIGGLVRPFTESGQQQIAGRVLKDAAGEMPVTGGASQIPGVEPTLAETSGNPGVAALQRALSSRPGNEALSLRQTANQEARSAYAQGLTGSAEDIANLRAARDQATLPMLDQAFANAQPVNPQPVVDVIDGILNGPAGKRDAIKSVLSNIRSKIVNGPDKTSVTPASAILDARGNPITPATSTTTPNVETDPAVLYQSVRKQIGDMLESQNPETRSNVKAVQQQLLQVRDALDDTIEQGAPGFAAYRRAYAQQSRPISALQTLQDMKLLGADGTQPVTLAKVRNAIGKIQSAKDNPNSRNLDLQAVSDDQLGALTALRDDLLQQQNLSAGQNTIRGSTTAQNLANGQLLDSQQPALVRMLLNGSGRSMSTGGMLGALLGQSVGGPGGAAAGAAIGAQMGTTFGNALRSKSPEIEARVLDLLLNPAKAEKLLSTQPATRFPLLNGGNVNAAASALGGSQAGRRTP